jgi:3-oxoacid CoA-transferase B subunit
LKDGDYANLGVGIPTLVANYLPKGVYINIHSENGMLGVGPYPVRSEVDPDLINPGKETVSETKGCSYFKSSDSFAIIRGGHLDLTILGALQVSSKGDLASWIIPGKIVKGMGGAMDLVTNGSKVIVAMKHTQKGKFKIFEECTFPLTGKSVVYKLITQLGVFEFPKDKGITLVETFKGITLDQVKAQTYCKFNISENLKTNDI